MITLRHIDRLFSEQKHPKLYAELTAGRPEADASLESTLSRAVPVAALGAIRLEELNQSSTPLYHRLINVILTSQRPDGGWSDPATTALCDRALIVSPHQDRAACGLANLASTQSSHGCWLDPTTTAFILLQLTEFPEFRSRIRFHDAIDYLTNRAHQFDPSTQRLWIHTALRCRAHLAPTLFTTAGHHAAPPRAARPAA